jgi:hypothetical protein
VRGPVGNPSWFKGQPPANPFGRPKTKLDGKKIRERVAEALTAFAEFVVTTGSQYSEAVQLLMEFAKSNDLNPSLRIAAAAAAAPYQQAKLQPVPGPQYLHTAIEIPEFESIEAAESFLLQLSQREGRKDLESQSVSTVYERVRGWIQSKRNGQELELKHAAQGQITGDQLIRIEGGLPELPGTNIDGWPHKRELNGHGPVDHLMQPNSSQIDSTPASPLSPAEVEAAPASSAAAGAATQHTGKP